MAAWIKMSLGMELCLGPGDFVSDEDPARHPKRGGGRSPQFSVHVYCGQTAGWMKLVLGTQVGLSPGDFVLDGDPAPSPKRGRSPSPIFGTFLLWTNGWVDEAGTLHAARPQPRRFCVRWGPSPFPKMGRGPLPNFWPISIMAKRPDASRCHLVRM